eukprot:m.9937 g.9937  ORF g.9937 m.9937 type:complete len:102 (+) comp5869_c0_seq1:265-570(+)
MSLSSLRSCVRQLHSSALLARRAGIHPLMFAVPHVCTNGAMVTINTTNKPTQDKIFLQEDIFNTAPWDPTAEVVKDTGGQVAKFNRMMEEHDFVVPGQETA